MRKVFILLATVLTAGIAGTSCSSSLPEETTMSIDELKDRIHGAWAGKVIGCTFGGPTEFKYSFYMNDDIRIPWDEHSIKKAYDYNPGLYDDVYMDLCFVDVFERCGLDAPVDSFARAFTYADFPLWHANAQARYNIMNGIMPPASGYWKNNPHADDIDFQIEADYAGIMAPGMVNAASHYCDGIGHMMNSGDGWYGGVYMAAMLSLAFVSDDIDFVVTEALKTIPSESLYYKAMADVIKWHKENPKDQEITWFLVNRKYGYEKGCPEGVQTAFNIDALMNSAYVLMGLLYGEKDFFKTINIATRCGADSDCNPSSAAGILGAMIGYEAIPELWRKPLEEVADQNFQFTDISINKATEMSLNQALDVIQRNCGSVSDGMVTIKTQKPQAVALEQNFEGIKPVDILFVRDMIENVREICFEGTGVVVRYNFIPQNGWKKSSYVAEVEAYIDGEFDRLLKLPADGNGYSPEFYYNYDLSNREHKLEFKWLNPEKDLKLRLSRVLIYSEE